MQTVATDVENVLNGLVYPLVDPILGLVGNDLDLVLTVVKDVLSGVENVVGVVDTGALEDSPCTQVALANPVIPDLVKPEVSTILTAVGGVESSLKTFVSDITNAAGGVVDPTLSAVLSTANEIVGIVDQLTGLSL